MRPPQVDIQGRVREVADGSHPFILTRLGKQIDNPAVAFTIVLEDNHGFVAHVHVLAQPYGSLQPVSEGGRDRLLGMANSCVGCDWFTNTVLDGGTQTFGLAFSSVWPGPKKSDTYYVGQKTRVSLGTWPGPLELNVDYNTETFPGNTSKEPLTVWGRVVVVSEYFDVSQSWILVEDTYGPGKHPSYTSILLLREDLRFGRGWLRALPEERLIRVFAMACADAEGRYRVGPPVRGEIHFDQLQRLTWAYIGHAGSRYVYTVRDDPSD